MSKVLIVEDDAELREVMGLALESEGYNVESASDGREALERLRGGTKPCLILLDLMMPVMNGWQFRDEQVHDPTLADIPVVVVSAATDLPTRATDLHASAYVRKPLRLNQLLDAVGQYCG